MSYKIHKPSILSHGKHNNLHFTVKVGGSKRNPMFVFKLVVFFDTEVSYITNSSINRRLKPFLNYEEIEKAIKESIAPMDYTLEVFGKNDFFVKNRKSKHILNRISPN